jgi:hypothetical protein
MLVVLSDMQTGCFWLKREHADDELAGSTGKEQMFEYNAEKKGRHKRPSLRILPFLAKS